MTDLSALVPLALSNPTRAVELARHVLADGPSDLEASYALHATGIVLRDRGELRGALDALRAALRRAARTGDAPRVADVQASLGIAEALDGRTGPGLARLDSAALGAVGLLRATVQFRRASVLASLGRHVEALAGLRAPLAAVRELRETLWEARILHTRCWIHLALGDLRRADDDARAAGRLFQVIGQTLESVQTDHNRAVIAGRRGDIPAALRLLEAADRRYGELGVSEPALAVDRVEALLAAGLAPEALATAERALARAVQPPFQQADLLLFAATAAAAAGRLDDARDRAQAARRRFRAQDRPGWELRARLLECQARYLQGDRSVRLLTASVDIATQMEERRGEDAALAHLLAARLLRERGRDALPSLRSAAGYRRRRGSALTRATGWLAAAMACDATGDERGLLAACGHGLDALDEHRLLVGAAELRAIASSHGLDLATYAIDAATRRGSARLMLTWSERSRAVTLAEPSVRPESDPALVRELGVVRDTERKLTDARRAGASTALAQRQRDAAEDAVRTRRRHLSGSAGSVPRVDVPALLASLGETTLVSLVESRGVLHVLAAGAGRVRRHEVGSIAAALHELDFALFALRRAAHGRPPGESFAALERAVLGTLAHRLPPGPVIVVPSTRFHALPWGLLPGLADRVLTAAPSALAWQRAAGLHRVVHPGRGVVLVAGPGLGTRGREVAALAAAHPAAQVLGAAAGAAAAGAEQVVAAMSGAWLVHLAAHGSFRAESPLFSSLQLDDGPLFVHDLDHLAPAPRYVVLSACDTGVAKAVGSQELLGLVTGLLRVGTPSVLASVVPVNDDAAVAVMTAVHGALAAGSSMPQALREARRAAAGDALAAATAGSFTAWGA